MRWGLDAWAKNGYHKQRQEGLDMEQSAARVVIIGPKSLSIEDAHALRSAFASLGARAVAYRTDVDFLFTEFKKELEGTTHLLVVLDTVNGYTDTILWHADKVKISTSFLCLHTIEILSQFERRIKQAKVDVLIVRSHIEHAHVRAKWSLYRTLVAENIGESADKIADAIVQTPLMHRAAA